MIIASDARTSRPTTSRLLKGPVVFEEYRGATARRTGEPSAATRALRFLGTGPEVSEVAHAGGQTCGMHAMDEGSQAFASAKSPVGAALRAGQRR